MKGCVFYNETILPQVLNFSLKTQPHYEYTFLHLKFFLKLEKEETTEQLNACQFSLVCLIRVLLTITLQEFSKSLRIYPLNHQNSMSKIYGFQGAVKFNAIGCGQVREAMKFLKVLNRENDCLILIKIHIQLVHFQLLTLRKYAQTDLDMSSYIKCL